MSEVEQKEKKKKKKGNAKANDSSKQTTEKVTITNLSGREEVRRLLRDFHLSRTRSIDLMENLLNLYNKKTYYQKDKITEITSQLASASSFSGLVEEELLVHIEALRKERIKLFEIIKRLQDTWHSYISSPSDGEKEDLPVSTELIEQVLSQVTQQTALDELIADQLLFFPHKPRTQDELITMASCIKLNPYLNQKDLKWLIDNL